MYYYEKSYLRIDTVDHIFFLQCFKKSSDNNGDSGSGVAVDTTPPVVNSVYPAEDATGIATNIQI